MRVTGWSFQQAQKVRPIVWVKSLSHRHRTNAGWSVELSLGYRFINITCRSISGHCYQSMAPILKQFNDVVRRVDYIEPCINVAAPTAWRGDRDSGRVIERMGLVAGIRYKIKVARIECAEYP